MDDDLRPDAGADLPPLADEAAPPDPPAPVDPEVSALFDDWLASVTDEAGSEAPARDVPPGVPPGSGGTLLAALAAGEVIEAAPAGALPAAAADAADARRQRFVVFDVAGSLYAVPETFVTEVERVPPVTRVPRVPAWVRGVTSLRGDVLSVVDLRAFLGLEFISTHSGRLLVVRLPDEELVIGMLVDAVDRIASVPEDAVRPPASAIEGTLAPFLTGVCHVGDRLVAVLDLDRLLRSSVIRQFEDRREAEPAA